jgi:hypothetical protein
VVVNDVDDVAAQSVAVERSRHAVDLLGADVTTEYEPPTLVAGVVPVHPLDPRPSRPRLTHRQDRVQTRREVRLAAGVRDDQHLAVEYVGAPRLP